MLAAVSPIKSLKYWNRGACSAFRSMEKVRDKQTVLIVDDEPLIRLYVRGVLEDEGHLTKEASNAEDALKLIEEDGITLVVTDIDMPGGMDGLALAREVRATRPNIAVIVTSGRHLPRPDEMPSDAHFTLKALLARTADCFGRCRLGPTCQCGIDGPRIRSCNTVTSI